MSSVRTILSVVVLVFAGAVSAFGQTEVGASGVSSGASLAGGSSEVVAVETLPLEFASVEVAERPLASDTLRLFVPQINLERSPFAFGEYPVISPFLRDAVGTCDLLHWRYLHFTAEGRFSEKPFLLVSRGVAFGVSGGYGPLTYDVSVTAQNYAYMPLGSLYQVGVSGFVHYEVSDWLSLTAFAQLYNVNPCLGMGAYPFVSTSRYGGYVTLENDRVGVDLGAMSYFDPMVGGWITTPIVTPKVKLWDSVTVSVPVGGMIRNAYDSKHQLPPPGPKDKR